MQVIYYIRSISYAIWEICFSFFSFYFSPLFLCQGLWLEEVSYLIISFVLEIIPTTIELFLIHCKWFCKKLCHFIDNNNIRWILSMFLLKINESFLFLLFIKLLLIVKRLIIEAMHCFFLTCCWFGFLISRSIKIIVFHLFRKNIFPSFFPKISINKIDYFYFVKKSFRLKREFVSVVCFCLFFLWVGEKCLSNQGNYLFL